VVKTVSFTASASQHESALVCYTQAVKRLKNAGVKLKGDVIIAAVSGESKDAVGEYQARNIASYGTHIS